MTDDPHPFQSGLKERWHRAPSYLIPLFPLLIGVMCFLPDPARHFGGGWAWVYQNWDYIDGQWICSPRDPRWLGAILIVVSLGKIISVEAGWTLSRGWFLVPIAAGYVALAVKIFVVSGKIGPGTFIYPIVATLVYWWRDHAASFDSRMRQPRMGA